jgi:hypothetical protein
LDMYLLALYLFFGIASKASTQFPAQPQAVWQHKFVNVFLRVIAEPLLLLNVSELSE